MHIVTIVMWWGKHYLEIEWSAQSHSSISQIFLNLALPGWMQGGMAEQSKCQDENRMNPPQHLFDAVMSVHAILKCQMVTM